MTDLIRGAGHAQELALRIAQEAADRFQERAEKAEAVIPGLVEVLEATRVFIASEYADPRASALEGHPLSREARPAFDAICNTLDAARKAGF
jgi:hypothetical protein